MYVLLKNGDVYELDGIDHVGTWFIGWTTERIIEFEPNTIQSIVYK